MKTQILYLFITLFAKLIIYNTWLVRAQYEYIGSYTKTQCYSNGADSPASYAGYSCSGEDKDTTCDAYLTYRSRYPYGNLSYIASLLEVDYDKVVEANPEWDTLVYVPVTCDCSTDSYLYLKTVSYTVGYEALYEITNNTFQGLTTCQALQQANPDVDLANGYSQGVTISVPLRCACPTNDNQTMNGVISLTTYVVGDGDTISSIASQLNVSSQNITEANELEGEDSIIYPFTTLLIPNTNDDEVASESPSPAPSPSSPSPPSPFPPSALSPSGTSKFSSPPPRPNTLSKGAIGSIAAALSAVLLAALAAAAFKFKLCGCRSTVLSCFNRTTNIFNDFNHKETNEEERNITNPSPISTS